MADKLKVLACSDSFYPPRGGGDISLRMTCSVLSRSGFSVSACYAGERSDPEFESYPQKMNPVLRGMWPRMYEMMPAWKRRLARVIAKATPDVVIAQQTVYVPTAEVCRRVGVPVVVLLQNVDPFCLGSFWAGHPWKCRHRCIGCPDAGPRVSQYPFFLRVVKRARKAMSLADAVISNSEFTRKTLKDLWGVESICANPLSEFVSNPQTDVKPEKILFFSPMDYKGVGTALELARRLRDEQFLFVGTAKPSTIAHIQRFKNVEYVPWLSDPTPAYGRAKLLIVPSVIPEGYGLVCMEAMSRGIPCVVSGVGALPDTVGRGGDTVLSHTNVDEWVQALGRYGDASYRTRKSKLALEEASKYSVEKSAAKVVDLVNDVISSKRRSPQAP